MKFPEALYHYTVGPKLPLIAESGRLLPAKVGAMDSREKPVLWWSANKTWDPTATKLVSFDGGRTVRRSSLDELRQLFGAYRFRLDTHNPAALHNIGLKLLPWTRAPMAARIPADDVARMTSVGVQMGATPMDWWGCLEEVPLSLETTGMLRLDRLGTQGWEPVEGGVLVAATEISSTKGGATLPRKD